MPAKGRARPHDEPDLFAAGQPAARAVEGVPQGDAEGPVAGLAAEGHRGDEVTQQYVSWRRLDEIIRQVYAAYGEHRKRRVVR